MTRKEAINKAQLARHAAKLALARHALYASTFGGNDKLTQQAMLEHDVAYEAGNKWLEVAFMHPATRASLLRKQALPSFMFGYGV
jgi:hypothetical protein